MKKPLKEKLKSSKKEMVVFILLSLVSGIFFLNYGATKITGNSIQTGSNPLLNLSLSIIGIMQLICFLILSAHYFKK